MPQQALVVRDIPVAGALTVAPGVLRYVVPFACELVEVRVTASTAPTGADLIFDIDKNGTTIFTDQTKRPKILAGAFASAPIKVTPGVAPGANVITSPVPDAVPVATFAAGDYVTINVEQIGSTVAGSNAVVTLVLAR